MSTADYIRSRSGANESGCRLWQRGWNKQTGYGRAVVARRSVSAHRLAYEVFRGPIPAGSVVMHTCDTRLCVNPDHLVLGTQKDNLDDMARKGRDRRRGEANGRAKLTWPEVAEIRASYLNGETQKSLAIEYGVSRFCIHQVVTSKSWKEHK